MNLHNAKQTNQLNSTVIKAKECFHCLEPIPKYCNLVAEIEGRKEPMCCIGCQAAAEFISQRGLMKFYQHRGRLDRRDFFAEVANDLLDPRSSAEPNSAWRYLDSAHSSADYVSQESTNRRNLTVLVEGLYCSSCTWLITRALYGISASIEVHTDVDAKRVHILVTDPAIEISRILSTIAQLGYSPKVCKLGDASEVQKLSKQQRNKSIQRIVVAGFGMMQVMTYATASYFGGSAESELVRTVVDTATTANATIMAPQLERFFLLASMLVATAVVFYSGRPFFENALNDIRNKHLGMDVPIALAIAGAYFPSVYQVLSNTNSHVYFDSAVMFVFFLSVGRYIEMRARHRLTGSDLDVQSLLPEEISVQRQQGEGLLTISIKPNEIVLGDKANFKTGAIIPFDGIINRGAAQLDQSLLTGEAIAVEKHKGARVLAGSKLLSGNLAVESTGSWSASSIAKVQQSIQAADRTDANKREYNRLLSQYFTLAVLVLTAVVASVWFVIAPERVFEICLAMLIASCPCAFALASPVGRSAAIHSLKRVGVLLVSNAAFDSVLNVTRWCFDKTGTLTLGQPSILKIIPLGELSEEECLQIVASIERESEHILSTAFNSIQTEVRATNFEEVVGQGVKASVEGENYRVGKRTWVLEALGDSFHGIDIPSESQNAEVLLADESGVLAIIQLRDEPRPSARALYTALRSAEFNTDKAKPHPNIIVLSGDHEISVQALCKELGLSDYRSNLLPADKLDLLRHYQNHGEVVAMVGDGVNDAPVLAAADVSIGMASGSELALNNADVVLLNGNLTNLNVLINVARKASAITKQNLAWALVYNAIALPLAASGLFSPWIAALGMSLSSVLVVLNALRIQNAAVVNPGRAPQPIYAPASEVKASEVKAQTPV